MNRGEIMVTNAANRSFFMVNLSSRCEVRSARLPEAQRGALSPLTLAQPITDNVSYHTNRQILVQRLKLIDSRHLGLNVHYCDNASHGR